MLQCRHKEWQVILWATCSAVQGTAYPTEHVCICRERRVQVTSLYTPHSSLFSLLVFIILLSETSSLLFLRGVGIFSFLYFSKAVLLFMSYM